MKRILALIITVALCLFCLASCAWFYTDRENEFFSDELLSSCKLSDMPRPPHVDNSRCSSSGLWGNTLYLNLTGSEYEQYVEDLLDYLCSKDDIYYLGYSVGSGLLGEILPYDEIAPVADSYDIGDDEHRFFFSTVDALVKNDMLDSPVEIGIIRESGKLRDGYEYNTEIILCDGSLASAMWMPCGGGHTYDEGIKYRVPGSDRTVTEYTCVNCGSTKSSEYIGDGKKYSLTLVDNSAAKHVISYPIEAPSGVIVEITASRLIDVDLVITVNGAQITSHSEDGSLVYRFVMPCCDAVIEADIVGGGPAPLYTLLRNLDGAEWLNEVSAEDVSEIKIIKEYVGVAPGSLKEISSTTNPTVISRIFEEYYWLETYPISDEQGMIAGGQAVTLKLLLESGEEKTLYFNNGNYLNTGGGYFELSYIPRFIDGENYVARALGFVTYLGSGEVYDAEGKLLCEIPMDELEFISVDESYLPSGYGVAYTVESELGSLRFIEGEILAGEGGEDYIVIHEYYFSIDGVPSEYYMLVGKGLDELIAEYSAE